MCVCFFSNYEEFELCALIFLMAQSQLDNFLIVFLLKIDCFNQLNNFLIFMVISYKILADNTIFF